MWYYVAMQKIPTLRKKFIIQLPVEHVEAIRALPGYGRGAKDITIQSFTADSVAEKLSGVRDALHNLFMACAGLPLAEMERMQAEIDAASQALKAGEDGNSAG